MCKRDKDCTKHCEYKCLDIANKYFKKHHKDTECYTDYRDTRTCYVVYYVAGGEMEHNEDHTCKGKCNSMTSHHVGKESDNKRQWLCEDTYYLDDRHQWYWHL